MDGSLINSYFSQFTSQTSLASFSDIYSMSSIYQVTIAPFFNQWEAKDQT